MPGLALHALEVEDSTSDTGGPGFGWEIRNAHTRLWAATRPHKKGNDVVFEGGGGRAGKASAPGNSEMTLVKLMRKYGCELLCEAEETGCECSHPRMDGAEGAADPRQTRAQDSATAPGPAPSRGP